MRRNDGIRLVLAAVVLTAAVGLCACAKEYPAENESQIESFLKDQEISVAGEPSKKDIFIPEEFSDVYEGYNELQISQGFDLRGYKAREAQVYTYDVVSVCGEHREDTQAHIIVCDGRIIGGDIAGTAIDGEMSGVIKKK